MVKGRLSAFAKFALDSVLWCLALCVLIQNWILVAKLRRMEQDQPILGQIVQGRRITAAVGSGLDGSRRAVSLIGSGQKTLVITISPGCPACESNLPRWGQIVSALKRRSSWRVLWLSRDSLDATEQYRIKFGIPASDVLAEPSYPTYQQFGLRSVPSMVVVSEAGVVERTWDGLLRADAWSAAFAYLGIEAASAAPLFDPRHSLGM